MTVTIYAAEPNQEIFKIIDKRIISETNTTKPLVNIPTMTICPD